MKRYYTMHLFSLEKVHDYWQRSYYFKGKVIKTFYIPIFNSPRPLETTFALQTCLGFRGCLRVREKSIVLVGKTCGVVHWVFFGEWLKGESTEAIGVGYHCVSVGIGEGCRRTIGIGVVTSAAAAQQRLGFREVSGKEDEGNGSGFTSGLWTSPQNERGPCAFRPNADARCSLGLSSARVLSARLDVYGSSAPSNPAAQLGGLIGRLGSSAWWIGITIIYRFQGFWPFRSRFCP